MNALIHVTLCESISRRSKAMLLETAHGIFKSKQLRIKHGRKLGPCETENEPQLLFSGDFFIINSSVMDLQTTYSPLLGGLKLTVFIFAVTFSFCCFVPRASVNCLIARLLACLQLRHSFGSFMSNPLFHEVATVVICRAF